MSIFMDSVVNQNNGIARCTVGGFTWRASKPLICLMKIWNVFSGTMMGLPAMIYVRLQKRAILVLVIPRYRGRDDGR